jgi:putative hydrolase of the HAD superfamily
MRMAAEGTTMSWVLFDYGGVICYPQPEEDLAGLARAAGCTAAEFSGAYWPYRLDYDRAVLDSTGYWQRVAGRLGRSFGEAQIAELSSLDVASWMHLQAGTVALVEDMAATGHRLALLSNAPADVAEAVSGLPVAAHFEHLIFSCYLKSAKPDPECFYGALAVMGAGPGEVTLVDDRADNVAGAARVGIAGLRFTTPAAARDALLPDRDSSEPTAP